MGKVLGIAAIVFLVLFYMALCKSASTYSREGEFEDGNGQD